MATNFYILQKSVCHAIGFNFCDNEYLLLKIPLLEEKNLNKNDFYNGKKKKGCCQSFVMFTRMLWNLFYRRV